MKIEVVRPPKVFTPVQITLTSPDEVIALRFLLSAARYRGSSVLQEKLENASSCITYEKAVAFADQLYRSINSSAGVEAECPK